jgi:hypothetical protein
MAGKQWKPQEGMKTEGMNGTRLTPAEPKHILHPNTLPISTGVSGYTFPLFV